MSPLCTCREIQEQDPRRHFKGCVERRPLPDETALVEENERLRANYEVLNAKWADDDKRVEKAEAMNAALVEALGKYGVHQPGCWLAAPQRRRPANERCSCGLDEALRKAEEAK